MDFREGVGHLLGKAAPRHCGEGVLCKLSRLTAVMAPLQSPAAWGTDICFPPVLPSGAGAWQAVFEWLQQSPEPQGSLLDPLYSVGGWQKGKVECCIGRCFRRFRSGVQNPFAGLNNTSPSNGVAEVATFWQQL